MSKKCLNCRLINFPEADKCVRCDGALVVAESLPVKKNRLAGLAVRAAVFVGVCIIGLTGFYLSLIWTAKPLSVEEKATVRRAIDVLKAKGFTEETILLESVTSFRTSDNWLNASVAKENAYAATNFPFEIMTLYPDFFAYPADDIERAAILLHEARHLKGKDEKDAYEYVWKRRHELGWTKDKYLASPVWENVRRQTKDNAPNLFVCGTANLGDCTEIR